MALNGGHASKVTVSSEPNQKTEKDWKKQYRLKKQYSVVSNCRVLKLFFSIFQWNIEKDSESGGGGRASKFLPAINSLY